MIYFTSDLHFRHDRVIKHANRPFRDAEEMDRVLLNNWNNTVGRDDEVYMLGDLTMKGSEVANSILTKLNGGIHIIRGNHDKFLDQRDFKKYNVVEVTHYKELVYNNTRFVLFHYPIEEWNHYFRHSIHLHGHQHNHADYNLNNRDKGLLKYDVGVDANNFRPVSIDDILEFFK